MNAHRRRQSKDERFYKAEAAVNTIYARKFEQDSGVLRERHPVLKRPLGCLSACFILGSFMGQVKITTLCALTLLSLLCLSREQDVTTLGDNS